MFFLFVCPFRIPVIVQKMFNFQNLQNLASLQQQKLTFVDLAGLSSASTCLNSPLNLSLSSASHTDPSHMNATDCSTSMASELAKNLCGTTPENYSPQMPQLILASVKQNQCICNEFIHFKWFYFLFREAN